MNFINLLGCSAACLTTIAFLPQMLRTWKTRSAKDVSLSMLITFLSGIFLWFLYGILRQDIIIVIANLVTLILNFAILGMKLKYK
jgi:MtN3 and saliva related transmembrane protein